MYATIITIITLIASVIANAFCATIKAIRNAAVYIWQYPAFKAFRGYVFSKWISFVVFYYAACFYISLPPETPFIELFYVGITIFSVALFGPLLRLMLFNEATLYAECGGLANDLKLKATTNALKHYWFATTVSYLIPILCFATVSK